MTIYRGAKQPIAWRYYWQPICVTNKDKALFWALAVAGSAAQGFFVGLLIGAGLAVLAGAPLVASGGGAPLAPILGAVVTADATILGTLVGLGLGAGLAWKSSCPECGACFKILGQFPFSRLP